MPVFRLSSTLSHPAESVFSWHMRPGALERLTPPWESVEILEREGEIRDGGTVLLLVKRGLARIRWKIKHTDFIQNRQFRDEQISGPFGSWVHTHTFDEQGDSSSTIEDTVEWEAPLWGRGKCVRSATRGA